MKRVLTIIMAVGLIAAVPNFVRTAQGIELPQTGQTSCYDQLGNLIACTGTGQDGEVRSGATWPTPRFVDHNDGTIRDSLTGLMWLKDTRCLGQHSWQDALTTVASFNSNSNTFSCQDLTATYTDWHLPNVNEIESLVNAEEQNLATWLNSQGFNVVSAAGASYWLSTTGVAYPSNAFAINPYYAGLMFTGAKGNQYYAWPVRSVSTPSTQIWKTGQITCYDASGNSIDCSGTGQDGETQTGAEWPLQRFVDNADGTVTDNLTGLMWLKDANCFGAMQWQNALSTVINFNTNPLNYSCQDYTNSYSDWRLPNRKESFSLSDFSQYSPAVPSANPFVNIQGFANFYWTSTTHAYDKAYAWVRSQYGGQIIAESYNQIGHKVNSIYIPYVWPVRTVSTQTPDISVTPSSHDFGDITVGGSSLPLEITISNNGLADLHVSDIVISDTTNFSLVPTGGTTPCGIAPTITSGSNCNLVITFNPVSTGIHNSTLSIVSDDPDTPSANVQLSGKGDDHGSSCDSATSVALGSTIGGVIEPAGDTDYFYLYIPIDGTLTVYTTGDTDTHGELKDTGCSTILADDDSSADNNFRIVSPITKGDYYIAVSGSNNSSGTGNYLLHVSYETHRLLTTQWGQRNPYSIYYDLSVDPCQAEILSSASNKTQYVVGCTAVAVSQLINYWYQNGYPRNWLDVILRDVTVYPRFVDGQQVLVKTCVHSGYNTLNDRKGRDSSEPYPNTISNPNNTEAENLRSFLWIVAIGLDASFHSYQEGTFLPTYPHEPYDWVKDSRDKLQSLLVDRFRFNSKIEHTDALTRLDSEKSYIVDSINRGEPVLIEMAGSKNNCSSANCNVSHNAIIDAYKLYPNGVLFLKINFGWQSSPATSDVWYDARGTFDDYASYYNWDTFYIFKYTTPAVTPKAMPWIPLLLTDD